MSLWFFIFIAVEAFVWWNVIDIELGSRRRAKAQAALLASLREAA